MQEKRVKVWVQKFADRPALMLQWLDPETGKRKSLSTETDDADKAEQKRADKEYELNHGLHRDVSRITWANFRELFWDEYVLLTRPDTQRNFAATLDLFERLCNPTGLLNSITERTISRFSAGMLKLPGRRKGSVQMMQSTIKVRLQFLHTALSWAAGQKMLGDVPKFPTIKPPKRRPQVVPAEAFERLLHKATGDVQMQAYLLCGWLAGLRLNEALALEWEPTDKAPYLDLSRPRIILPAAFVKAGEDQWIPLDQELREAIELLPRQGEKVFRFVSWHGKPITRNGISLRVRTLAAKAGVQIMMHTLRKGFGCRYAGKVSAHVLQRLMRHANIKTTLDYYANIDEAVEEAVFGAKQNRLRNSSRNSAQNMPVSQETANGASSYAESTN